MFCRLQVLSHFATEQREKERLEYFSTAEGREEVHRYNQREGRSVLEILQDFPSAHLPLHWLLQLAPRLQPRAFSISSAQTACCEGVEITVAVVEWRTPYKRIRVGLASSWLATLNPTTGGAHYAPMWIQKGVLRLPPPQCPSFWWGPARDAPPFGHSSRTGQQF